MSEEIENSSPCSGWNFRTDYLILKIARPFLPGMLVALSLCSSCAASAQQTFGQRFLGHNAAMARIQPAWPTPVIAPDPRLGQYYRLSVSSAYAPSGTHTMDYGNSKGFGVIVPGRLEFDAFLPGYMQHHSSAADGFGDFAAMMKVRLASRVAERGSYVAGFALVRTFPTGSDSNGAMSGAWIPSLAGGVGVTRRIDVEASLGGVLPTGKIEEQGRAVLWNVLAQAHTSRNTWFEFEDNATHFHGGPHNGRMQNFLTPAEFLFLRSSQWGPAHPFFIVDAAMQIATSAFHLYNHNLILETRFVF